MAHRKKCENLAHVCIYIHTYICLYANIYTYIFNVHIYMGGNKRVNLAYVCI